MSTKTKHFIFDFDGVLGDTWSAMIKAVMEIDNLTMEEAIRDMSDYAASPKHSRKNNLTKDELAEWMRWTDRFGRAMARIGFKLFDEFIAEIKKIENKKVAIVSSGSKLYVKDKADSSDLDFTHILTFEDSPSKEEKVEMICRDWNVDIKDIHYFTDTKTDVIELKEMLGDRIIGCSWGYNGYFGLLEVLPEEKIMEDFMDIHLI